MNWAMALACGNTDVILSSLCFMCSGAADEGHYSHFSEQHSHWNKKCEGYCYTYEEFHRLRMGSF